MSAAVRLDAATSQRWLEGGELRCASSFSSHANLQARTPPRPHYGRQTTRLLLLRIADLVLLESPPRMAQAISTLVLPEARWPTGASSVEILFRSCVGLPTRHYGSHRKAGRTVTRIDQTSPLYPR